MLMEAWKPHNLQSANWRIKKTGSMILSRSEVLRTKVRKAAGLSLGGPITRSFDV